MQTSPRHTVGATLLGEGRPAAPRVALLVGVLVCLATSASCSSAADQPPTGAATSTASAMPAVPALPWPELPEVAFPADRANRMQDQLDGWVARGLLPGVTAAVATPQGVWSGAAGVDGAGAALKPESGMALASITKTFTAAEVMLLAERGKVDLDSPASTYLSLPQVANGVTVRQLLAQRAGIPDPGATPYDPVFTDPGAHWSPQDFLAPVAKATERPGERFSYQNANYVLLGLVVDRVTGVDTATALTRDLWAPLRLTRLAYQDQQRLPPPLARPGPDELLPEGAPDQPFLPTRAVASAVGAAGGVAGDAESTARWGYALYGARVLRPESVAQMTDFGDGDGYGLATVDFTSPRGRFARSGIEGVGHDGELPGYRSVMAVIPSRRTSVAILTPSSVDAVPYVKWLVTAGMLMDAAAGTAP